jgi:inosine/xanthosine triphosphate pyrophosphatase family protein
VIVRLSAPTQERADRIAAVLAPVGLRIRARALALPALPRPAASVAAAARRRALLAVEGAGGVVVLEDEALVVPALGGQPGQASSSFADGAASADGVVPEGTAQGAGAPREQAPAHERNVARLLLLMAGVPLHGRAAVLLTHVVAAVPRRVLFEAPAECHGWLLDEPRGAGPGYDAIFVAQAVPDRSLAELAPHARSRATGEGRALDDLLIWASRGGAL